MPIPKRPLLGLRAVSLPIRHVDFTCRESLSARSAQNPKSPARRRFQPGGHHDGYQYSRWLLQLGVGNTPPAISISRVAYEEGVLFGLCYYVTIAVFTCAGRHRHPQVWHVRNGCPPNVPWTGLRVGGNCRPRHSAYHVECLAYQGISSHRFLSLVLC